MNILYNHIVLVSTLPYLKQSLFMSLSCNAYLLITVMLLKFIFYIQYLSQKLNRTLKCAPLKILLIRILIIFIIKRKWRTSSSRAIDFPTGILSRTANNKKLWIHHNSSKINNSRIHPLLCYTFLKFMTVN